MGNWVSPPPPQRVSGSAMLPMLLLITLKIVSRSNNDNGVRSDNDKDEDAATMEAEASPPVTGYEYQRSNGCGLSEPIPYLPTIDYYS